MSRTPPSRRALQRIRVWMGLVAALLLPGPSTAANAPDPELQLPRSAVASDARVNGKDVLRGSLLLDLDAGVKRAGVLLELEPGWHLYWRNPGEVGIATEVEWQAGAARLGPIEWPAPRSFVDTATGLTSYGYEERVLLTSVIRDTASEKRIAANVSLLVCSDECVPAELELARPLAPHGSREQAAREHALFEQFRERVPRAAASVGLELDARYSQKVLYPGDSFEAAVRLDGCDSRRSDCAAYWPPVGARFFAELPVDEALEIESQRLVPGAGRKDAAVYEVKGRVAEDAEEPLRRLTGVLKLRAADGESLAVTVDLPFPSAPSGARSDVIGLVPADSELVGIELGIVRILLLALLGGLLINGMPCVLPVLGIKVCSAAELAQHDPKELRLHGLAYAGGILASMAALAGCVVLMRAAGTHVGWGFQFQEPIFVAAVASVVVLFAMNLFGVYEIAISSGAVSQVGSSSTGVMRSFFDGLLCVVLATPCTAPFLGTAVGFAFANGALLVFAIFLTIGAGLASPYVLVCLVPGWARFVPKPGNWMLRLRAGLGFLLMGTAVWLVWIFGRSGGVDSVAALLALLVGLAFGSWLLGWTQSLAQPRATLAAAAALVAFCGAGLGWVDSDRVESSPGMEAANGWAAFDADAIRESLASSRPVFVSFTADWCITCKVNERGVLADEQVTQAFDTLGFATFRGDWTQRDETIRSELARHGRAGVPLYLVYDPRTPDEPVVLPELLTVDTVLESLHRATGSAGPLGVELTQADAARSLVR